jgi:hypothetical protein
MQNSNPVKISSADRTKRPPASNIKQHTKPVQTPQHSGTGSGEFQGRGIAAHPAARSADGCGVERV